MAVELSLEEGIVDRVVVSVRDHVQRSSSVRHDGRDRRSELEVAQAHFAEVYLPEEGAGYLVPV